MDRVYWGLEYGKVFLAYILLMFVWPSVVFRNYLRGKSRTVRFAFCVTVSVVIVNAAVLCLGLLHILNRWTVCLFFYGTFFWSVFHKYRISEEKKAQIMRLFRGTQGRKLFLIQNIMGIRRFIRNKWQNLWQSSRAHALEYLVLSVVVVYGMVYFSYGAFQDYSYGFGDMYTHHSWIYGLLEGKIFSAGIYPEAMHCFIYSMHILFGVRVYSCLLFVAGIHVAIFLVGAYCLLKEMFRWRYTPMFVLTLFLTVDLLCIDEIFSMSRLQWTLPQEFGLYTQFLCLLFLVRYLKSEQSPLQKGKKIRERIRLPDENLLLFAMSLAASIAIHFYATIMAFFLCLSFAVFALGRIFRKVYFRGLVLAVLCGILIAGAPMGLALASGMPLQGSMEWGMNIIKGTDTNEGRTQQAEQIIESENRAEVPVPEGEVEAPDEIPEDRTELSLLESVQKLAHKIFSFAAARAKMLYQYGYVTLYRQMRAEWLVKLTVLSAALWLGYRVLTFLLGFFRKLGIGRQQKQYFDLYPPMIVSSVLFMLLYAAPFMGLPEIVAGARLCSTENLLLLTVVAIPVDMLFSLLRLLGGRCLLPLLSLACIGAIYLGSIFLGMFRGYLYYELTRYNEIVMVTEQVTRGFPKDSYTIVSPTDELYQVIQYGRHEELLSFVKRIDQEIYTLPTDYILLYVEKKPIEYAQSHFFTGPDWLAEEKYTQYYTHYFSEGEQINHSEISARKAKEELVTFSRASLSYSDLENRTILQSKAYEWCRQFSKLYGNEMNVYFENDNVVCYLIQQNPYRLYNLGVK